ncbi:MAG: hypothetical protein F4Z29_07515 [Gemmatimonadetes bacterium]|nr:hypothetical protein [Gemmatimonadota bacterium]
MVEHRPLEKPPGLMHANESEWWDRIVESVEPDHLNAGDAIAMVMLVRMIAEWLPLSRRFTRRNNPLSRFSVGSADQAVESPDSKLERELRKDILAAAQALGIVLPITRRRSGVTTEPKPKGALRLLDGEKLKSG